MDNENPFASPQTGFDQPPSSAFDLGQTRSGPPFESGHARAVAVLTLLAVGMLCDTIGVGSTLLELNLLQRLQGGEVAIDAEIEASDARQMIIGFVQIGIFFATALAYFIWIHRAHRNLPSLRARKLDYSPGWAIGWHFVPIMNLFRPYQVMREIWRNSDPKALGEGLAGRLTYSVPLIGWWWGLWLLNGAVSRVGMRRSLRAETIDEFIFANNVTLANDVLSVVVAVLLFRIVRQIDRNQTERHAIVAQSDASPEFADEFAPRP